MTPNAKRLIEVVFTLEQMSLDSVPKKNGPRSLRRCLPIPSIPSNEKIFTRGLTASTVKE